MDDEELDRLREDLCARKVGVRRRAVERISTKAGGDVLRATDDPRVVGLLTRALSDPSLSVRRAAARGLRPWVHEAPELLDSILPEYATNEFDGSYSHVGLYSVETGGIWVPRFAAVKGHAALLADADTDRYLKFEFFVPGQAPRTLRRGAEGDRLGHLAIQLIPEWSYTRACLVPDHDERRREANLREQRGYARRVVAFYR